MDTFYIHNAWKEFKRKKSRSIFSFFDERVIRQDLSILNLYLNLNKDFVFYWTAARAWEKVSTCCRGRSLDEAQFGTDLSQMAPLFIKTTRRNLSRQGFESMVKGNIYLVLLSPHGAHAFLISHKIPWFLSWVMEKSLVSIIFKRALEKSYIYRKKVDRLMPYITSILQEINIEIHAFLFFFQTGSNLMRQNFMKASGWQVPSNL